MNNLAAKQINEWRQEIFKEVYSLDKMLENEFEHLEVFNWQFLGEKVSELQESNAPVRRSHCKPTTQVSCTKGNVYTKSSQK